MKLEEKIKIICEKEGCSSNTSLAKKLELNHVVFNRNIREGSITGDMIKAIAKYTNTDMNWFLKDDIETTSELLIASEPNEDYGNNDVKNLSKIIEELNQLKEKMSRK